MTERATFDDRLAAGFRRLLTQEGLDDLPKLLTPREWDEVPLFSRHARLAFLGGLDPSEQSRVLLGAALDHLRLVIAHRDASCPRTLVMVSITGWDEFGAGVEAPEPLQPHFWITSDPERDLKTFRVRLGFTERARHVAGWLRDIGRLGEHVVLEPMSPTPEVPRVYVALPDDPRIAALLVVQNANEDDERDTSEPGDAPR